MTTEINIKHSHLLEAIGIWHWSNTSVPWCCCFVALYGSGRQECAQVGILAGEGGDDLATTTLRSCRRTPNLAALAFRITVFACILSQFQTEPNGLTGLAFQNLDGIFGRHFRCWCRFHVILLSRCLFCYVLINRWKCTYLMAWKLVS